MPDLSDAITAAAAWPVFLADVLTRLRNDGCAATAAALERDLTPPTGPRPYDH